MFVIGRGLYPGEVIIGRGLYPGEIIIGRGLYLGELMIGSNSLFLVDGQITGGTYEKADLQAAVYGIPHN